MELLKNEYTELFPPIHKCSQTLHTCLAASNGLINLNQSHQNIRYFSKMVTANDTMQKVARSVGKNGKFCLYSLLRNQTINRNKVEQNRVHFFLLLLDRKYRGKHRWHYHTFFHDLFRKCSALSLTVIDSPTQSNLTRSKMNNNIILNKTN
jgi:hypothetical protein